MDVYWWQGQMSPKQLLWSEYSEAKVKPSHQIYYTMLVTISSSQTASSRRTENACASLTDGFLLHRVHSTHTDWLTEYYIGSLTSLSGCYQELSGPLSNWENCLTHFWNKDSRVKFPFIFKTTALIVPSKNVQLEFKWNSNWAISNPER